MFILELAPQAARGKGAEIWTYRYKKVTADKRPAAPLDLTALAENDRINLTWKAGSQGVKEYQVSRAEAAETVEAQLHPDRQDRQNEL